MQSSSDSAELLAAVLADPDALVTAVAHDIARPGDEPGELRIRAMTAVSWLGEAALRGSRLAPAATERLRSDATVAAAAGIPVARSLDAVLSAGWVLLEAAGALPAASPHALAALGSTLLRLGDAAAAVIAGAYAAVERDAAARSAAARRAFLDELLGSHLDDTTGLARLARLAPRHGLDAATRHRVLLVAPGEDGQDEERRAAELAARIGPRTALAAPLHGRLLAFLRADAGEVGPPEAALAAMLDAVLGTGWRATLSAASPFRDLPAATARAESVLAVAGRLPADGRILGPGELGVERALLADPTLAASAVVSVLGSVRAARGGDELLVTLRTWLELTGNRHATARRLGLAPRTVAYRLERIERLLGAGLSGPLVLRLAAALIARELGEGGAIADARD